MSPLHALSADGHDARWETWDGEHVEHLTLRWENEAWTACGTVDRQSRLAGSTRYRRGAEFRGVPAALASATGQW